MAGSVVVPDFDIIFTEKIAVSNHVDQPLQIAAADAVAGIIDLRRLSLVFLDIVVESVP